MIDLIRWLLWAISKPVFALRYRVKIQGLDKLKGMKGILILPNHPAYMDPPLVLHAVWPSLRPRPMLLASALAHPLVKWLPRMLDAVEVPDLEKASTQALQNTQKAIEGLVETLKQGRNAILWPSGRLTADGLEHLGSSRSLYDILQAVPEAKVVLVRTQGLWGSRFSFAPTGEHPPDMVLTMLKGAGIALANLIFFTPKRQVQMTFQEIPREQIPLQDRLQTNRFLENWYNTPDLNKPVFVPYHFVLGPREYEFPAPADQKNNTNRSIKPEAKRLVLSAFEQKTGRPVPSDQEAPSTDLDDLGLDSLDRMELTLLIEQQSGFSSQSVPLTLGDLYDLAQGPIDSTPIASAPNDWFTPPIANKLKLLGDTIPKALLKRAIAYRKDIVVADDLSGALTYEKFFVAARTLSKRFTKIEAKNIAVMLPASVAADIIVAALHLAGKVPVMINWTTGKANVDHALAVMNVTHIISSRQFIDRLGITMDGVQFLYMEDLKKGIGKAELLWNLFRLRFTRASLLYSLPETKPDDTAVVLFTSGSEKAPKAVPLTHRNILSNLQSVIDSFDLSPRDKMLGFLPPFHSFGISVTSVFPVLAGLRVIHHPDPTAARKLGQKIATYQATIVCGTPTFIGYILSRSKPEDVASVRLWVAGAEKCPPRIFDLVKQMTPNAHLIEGYGITECSPMISVNRIEQNRPGTIGQPLPGVNVMIADMETYQPLPAGTQGMILVQGANVFPGYVGADMPKPFHGSLEKRWYITGDLGTMDADGFITFQGRLKRFIKAAGEMISLPAIEEPLTQNYPPTDTGPQVAVEGIETDKGRRIVLFTTIDITLSQANGLLSSSGLAGVMRLDAVQKMEAIPLLGTGKTDYKLLRKILEEENAPTA